MDPKAAWDQLFYAMDHYRWVAVWKETPQPLPPDASEELRLCHSDEPYYVKAYVMDDEERTRIEREHPDARFFDTMVEACAAALTTT